MPSWIACRASEKVPVITAWLMMIVVSVARMTSGTRRCSGAISKNHSRLPNGRPARVAAASVAAASAPWPR